MINFNTKEGLIDYLTIAIESYYKDDQRSKITKINGVFYSPKTPMELLNDCCLEYASTLDGRIKAVTMALNYNKPPVIIAPFDLCLFPTGAYHNYDSTMIFNHPFEVIKTGKGTAQLVFYESIKINVNASAYTIIQQQQRLHTVINNFRDLQKRNLRVPV